MDLLHTYINSVFLLKQRTYDKRPDLRATATCPNVVKHIMAQPNFDPMH
jgi:hypothetical protein